MKESDKKGFYRIDFEGNKWRPIDIQNGRLVTDGPFMEKLRDENKARVQGTYRAGTPRGRRP